jgi:hypothetical protein
VDPAPAAEESSDPTSSAESAAAPEEEAAETADEAPAGAESAEEPPAASSDLIAGLPASGTDPDTGLEINPAQIVPGVDFIVRGELVSFNLTPQDSPEFLLEAPSGTRYRVQSQPTSEIAFTDGSVLLPHQYQRGLLGQATVRQEEGAGVTTVVMTDNFVLLVEE